MFLIIHVFLWDLMPDLSQYIFVYKYLYMSQEEEGSYLELLFTYSYFRRNIIS